MKIGFVGLGLMGEAMSHNLLKKSGHSVMVFDFSKSQVDLLVSYGAKAAHSSKEIAQECDVIFTMVPKSEHVKAVYEEFLTVAKAGQIYVDMSTIDPDVSIDVAKKIAATGAVMLDAPVVKSRPAAIEGTLGIYVGGDQASFEVVKPLLLCMGNNVIYLGENGRGLVMKLCHNVLVTQIQNGVNELLTIARHFNIGDDDFATAVSYGGATNFYLTSKLNTLKSGDFTAAFSVENMHKDVHCLNKMLALEGLSFAGVQAATRIYDESMQDNLGKEDFSATIKTVKKLSQI